MIKIISAVAANGVIGQNNTIPWNYPDDMKFFRQMTLNSTIIMGRKTWESIKKPLPKRRNIVITRSNIEGVETFTSLEMAIESLNNSNQDIWLIGGSSIYRSGLEFANEIYLTLIPEKIEGDNLIYFPWINPDKFKSEHYLDLGEDHKLKVIKYFR